MRSFLKVYKNHNTLLEEWYRKEEVGERLNTYRELINFVNQNCDFSLFQDFKEEVANLLKNRNITPIFLFENLISDKYLKEVVDSGDSKFCDFILLLMAKELGLSPLSYKQEQSGELIHKIAPDDMLENSRTSQSRNELLFHTEHAILGSRFRPGYILLLGVINEDRIPTVISNLSLAIKYISHTALNILQMPKFRIGLPDSINIIGGKKILSEWRPLLRLTSEGEFEFSFNLHETTYLDSSAERSVNELTKALAKVSQSTVIYPGQLLLIDNNRYVHKRPRVTGNRLLKRLYCQRSDINSEFKESTIDIEKVLLHSPVSNY